MRKKIIIIISVIFPFSEKFVSVYKTIADSCEKYFFFLEMETWNIRRLNGYELF